MLLFKDLEVLALNGTDSNRMTNVQEVLAFADNWYGGSSMRWNDNLHWGRGDSSLCWNRFS